MFAIWMKLALDISKLSLETQQVIALRLLKLTWGGSDAPREATRMVTEKIVAIAETAAKVTTEARWALWSIAIGRRCGLIADV